MTEDAFRTPDPARARAARQFEALLRIAGRHAATDEQRHRHLHASVLDPHEAARLVLALAGGGAGLETGEPPLDETDLAAALTLIPRVRADLDVLEAGLITTARGRGVTWSAIAFGLGLGSAQAAQQRYERLAGRAAAGGPEVAGR